VRPCSRSGGISRPRVRTVKEAGWCSSSDHALLALAEKNFDVFVTIDRKLESQHNLQNLKLGFVIARVPDNKLASYQPLFEELKAAAERAGAGDVIHIGRQR
jgi:hypothetical protein